MEVLTSLWSGAHTIDFGVATTNEERESVLAQRFRVYHHEGYYKEGVREDRDEYDRDAVYFLGRLRSLNSRKSLLLGSARLIRGYDDPLFEFPCQKAYRFDLPEVARETPMKERAEISRLVSEKPRGVITGRLTTALGLLLAIGEYSERNHLRCGLATIKLRLLRALEASGLRLHEIPSDSVIYPRDGTLSGYYYAHPDPVVAVYWSAEEVIPSVRRAVGHCRRSRNGSRVQTDRSRRPRSVVSFGALRS